MRYSLILLLSLGFVVTARAQSFDKEKMDSLFTLMAQHDQGMGSISLYQNGQEIYAHAIGLADIEQNIKATPESKYRIGSVSKTFTATIIMQMVQENKLSMDTPLQAFFPQIPNADKITLAHLLRHRSGLYNYTNQADFRNWMDQAKSKEELLEIFVENGVDFEPGEKFAYANTNYVLLSFIAEQVDNQPFADILQARIIKPLSLKHTYFGGKINSGQGEAYSYYWVDGWQLATETDMSHPQGAGSIVSTPADVDAFLVALFNGKLVSEASLNQMTEIIGGYGIGLIQFPFYVKKAYGHDGRIDEFYAMTGYFPKDKLAITYLSNGIDMPINDIMIAALSIYFGRDYMLPDFKPALRLSPETLDQYPGTYSSPTFPLKVTITQHDSTLIGQATGQPSFPLEAIEENIFQFQSAGLVLEFVPGEKLMILKQGGGEYHLHKE